MSMEITKAGDFLLGRLRDTALSDKDRAAFRRLANEETADELLELAEEAQAIAEPVVLFRVCPAETVGADAVSIGGVTVESPLAAGKLAGKSRCFPYIATCGSRLEAWSARYKGDFLEEFWADEIKKRYLKRVTAAFFEDLKARYHTAGYLTALNPGSLKDWPISGQRELFQILGGRAFVEAQIGVTYTDSFLMLPSKTLSGIAFESSTFYENCQYCPLENCPNRRAARKAEEDPA